MPSGELGRDALSVSGMSRRIEDLDADELPVEADVLFGSCALPGCPTNAASD